MMIVKLIVCLFINNKRKYVSCDYSLLPVSILNIFNRFNLTFVDTDFCILEFLALICIFYSQGYSTADLKPAKVRLLQLQNSTVIETQIYV